MASESFFDARTCYEDGLRLCSGEGSNELKTVLTGRIDTANCRLAELNIREAESAFALGNAAKACDHLELVHTLTFDTHLREKAEKLLHIFSQTDNTHDAVIQGASCSSCSGSFGVESADSSFSEDSLSLLEYYDLLIHQLPVDQYQRYAGLGENFAYAYTAASRDEHHEALLALEKCSDTLPLDIYWYEKGKVLHRIGNDSEAEQHLRTAIQLNSANSLARFTLVQLLHENSRYQEALAIIDSMVAECIMPEQAQLLRAEIFGESGDYERAVNQYIELLETPYARVAAEKLHILLIEIGRHNDAAVIFKKYMLKSCH